jgi:hypothetical protein
MTHTGRYSAGTVFSRWLFGIPLLSRSRAVALYAYWICLLGRAPVCARVVWGRAACCPIPNFADPPRPCPTLLL